MFNDFDGESTGLYGAAPDDFLVFTEDTLCEENFAGSGVYQWAVDGDQLTLTLAQPETGGCTGRSDTLTFPRWKRVEDWEKTLRREGSPKYEKAALRWLERYLIATVQAMHFL